MAYVGTPKYLGSDRYTLASILQGEASSSAGQTAVASVISNRAASNYSGYGSSLIDQATARMQFQGQATPTAQSLSIADQALAGNLQSNVGDATAYAAPGSTASWAVKALGSGQGITIGGNTFFESTSGGTPKGVVASSPDGYMKVTDSLGKDPNGGSGTSTQNGAGFSSGAASGSDSVLNPATVPLAITTSQQAADATSKANTKSATDSFTGGIKSVTDTAKASYAAAHDALGDTLFRIALIVIGGIVLLGALWIIAAEQGAAPKPSTVLKKGAMALAA